MRAKALWWSFGGILALVALVVGLAYAFPLLKVNDIEVTGAAHVSVEEAEVASGLQRGENLVRISPQEAAAGVAQLPWVKSATVSRSFPDGVRIDIVERDAVAYSQAEDGAHLIDSHGDEFLIGEPPAEAVALRGGESGSPNWQGAVEILAALPPELRVQAREIDTTDRFNYVFHMNDDRVVVWGASEDNADKARALAAVLQMEGNNWNISNPELVTSA